MTQEEINKLIDWYFTNEINKVVSLEDFVVANGLSQNEVKELCQEPSKISVDDNLSPTQTIIRE